MTDQIARTVNVAPVRKTLVVRTSPDHAFEVFTAGMSRWWLKQFSINRGSPIKEIVIEPQVGGRWYEVGEDGSSCQWGKVLAWQPPSRLTLAWQITPEFRFDPGLVTELDIRFTPEENETRVSLEHRLDGYGAAAADMFRIFDGPDAWMGLLESFARTID